jgi:signal transduction histidine kinase
VRSVIENVIAVVERTEHGERVTFDVNVPDTFQVPVAAEDLTEMLGALIENGARHARRQLRIEGAVDAHACIVKVEDDGPGIERDALQSVMLRGGRLDEAGPGHGLGLAIVSDLVQTTGGTITLDRAQLGGLQARLAWPIEPQTDRGVRKGILGWLTRR